VAVEHAHLVGGGEISANRTASLASSVLDRWTDRSARGTRTYSDRCRRSGRRGSSLRRPRTGRTWPCGSTRSVRRR
jgi:hypothetical protein